MNGSFFVDTNIFVYHRDLSEAEKQKQAEQWLGCLWHERNGRTSIQVLNEFFVTVTNKLAPGMPAEDAWADVEALMTWEPLQIDERLMKRAKTIHQRFHLSWWDSLVVAAAILSECEYILTEDLQNDQIIDGVRIVNPFVHSTNEFNS